MQVPTWRGDHGSISPSDYTAEGTPYVRVQNLGWGFDINPRGLVHIPLDVHRANAKSTLVPNDIVVAKTGATVGKTAIIPDWITEANTTSSVAKLTVDRSKGLPRYIGYAIRSAVVQNQIWEVAAQKSAQPGFDIEDFARFRVPLPPIGDQGAIVRFLDHFDRQIRRAIRDKQTLISLLNEQEQAVIYGAVTRGLEPSVPLRSSGVEWLGRVPDHWEVRRIKSLSLVKRGASPRPIADPKFFDDDGEYAWVRIADVSASRGVLETTTQRLSDLGKSLSVPLEPGSLFLSIAGSVGKPVITRIKCCIHDGFVYFPSYRGDVRFLYRVFESGKLFDGLGKLGTQLNLNTETVGRIKDSLSSCPRAEGDR
jgi:type I restriction enzyme, S subunit